MGESKSVSGSKTYLDRALDPPKEIHIHSYNEIMGEKIAFRADRYSGIDEKIEYASKPRTKEDKEVLRIYKSIKSAFPKAFGTTTVVSREDDDYVGQRQDMADWGRKEDGNEDQKTTEESR